MRHFSILLSWAAASVAAGVIVATCAAQTAPSASQPSVSVRELTVRIRSVDADAETLMLGSSASDAMAAVLATGPRQLPSHYVGDMVLHVAHGLKLTLLDERATGPATRPVALADVLPGGSATIRYAPDDITPKEVIIRGMEGWGVVQKVDVAKAQVEVRNNRGDEVLTVLPDARMWRSQRDVSAAPLTIALADLKPMTALHFTFSALEKDKLTVVGETSLDLKQALVNSVDAKQRTITLEFRLIDQDLKKTFTVAPDASIGSFDIKTGVLPLAQLAGHRVEAQLHAGDPTIIDELNIDIPVPESLLHRPAPRASHPSSRPSTRATTMATSRPATEPMNVVPQPPKPIAPAPAPTPKPLAPPVEIPGVN